MTSDQEAGMKQLVVSALAYYGLKVFHIFDGRDFKACLKVIERDGEKALQEFTEVVNITGIELLEKFVREFCRPDLSVPTPAAQLVPEPILKLVAPAMAQQGNINSSSIRSRIWATLSTFVKDNSGDYIVPQYDRNHSHVGVKINDGVQLHGKFKVEDVKIGIGDLVQKLNVSGPPAGAAPCLPYSPTKDYSSLRNRADARQQSSARKRDGPHHVYVTTRPAHISQEDSGHPDAKRLRVQSVGEEIEKAREPGQWQENLAKEWPHIFHEIQENFDAETQQTEMEESFSCAHPSPDLPALIEVEMLDANSVHDEPLERKRKRTRGTDEKASGGTLLDDSSLESIGHERYQVNCIETLEPGFTICAGDEEKKVRSEVGSRHTTANGDLANTGDKRNRTSWPAPLYGDQTRAKSSLPSLELREEEDICTHKVEEKALDTCAVCKRKEEVAFSKYTRLFKDDLTWKQKFLDGENLTCDICSSKGKVTIFIDITLLLSHARKELELRGPEHRGYARAIHDLIQFGEPGNIRTCHSAVCKTTPIKTKRVWPPVIVLENTFKASDLCSDLKLLDEEVTTRLKASVNIDEHTLHKVTLNGYFDGTILVEFPPSRRGLNDANRLNQHFLLTGRSLQDWIRVRDKRPARMRYATGVQESCDLVKIGERGEVRSRIYFGYLATVKIMTRLDTFRRFVKWRVREAKFLEDDVFQQNERCTDVLPDSS